MPTVLHSVTSAKPVRCRDCRKALEPRHATWNARCVPCEDAAEARRSLEKILASGDAHAISEAASWLHLVETDAAVFRSDKARESLDRAVVRACKIADAEAKAGLRMTRSKFYGDDAIDEPYEGDWEYDAPESFDRLPAAVREVRDPILVGDDEDVAVDF